MSVIERLLGRGAPASGPIVHGGVEISKMRKRDLRGGVLDIEAQCYPRPWSYGVFAGELDQVKSASRVYLVARYDGRIAGYAGLWFTADEAHVTNVAVEPTLRRRGVARSLMLALADEMIRRSCTAWTLEVRVSSAGAQELYRTFGFEPAGVRKRYYENVEDAIVMWCRNVQTIDYRRRLDQMSEYLSDGG